MLRRAFLSYDSHIIFAYTTSLQSNIFLVYALPTPSLPPSLSPSLLFLSCLLSFSIFLNLFDAFYLHSPSPLFYNSPTCLLHCLFHSSYLSLPVLFLPYLFIFSLSFSIFVTTISASLTSRILSFSIPLVFSSLTISFYFLLVPFSPL